MHSEIAVQKYMTAGCWKNPIKVAKMSTCCGLHTDNTRSDTQPLNNNITYYNQFFGLLRVNTVSQKNM